LRTDAAATPTADAGIAHASARGGTWHLPAVVGSGGVVAMATPEPVTATGVAPDPGTCRGIVTVRGDELVRDGRPVFLFGVNAHYLMDDEFPEELSHLILAELAARGVNSVRVWYFHNEDPDRFARLLDTAGAHGLTLVVTLADNVFKGRNWFFDEEDEEDYRPHVERTVARFRDRPEIAAWEVINEPNCGDGAYDDDCLKTIRDWVTMAARIVRAQDECRPISTGMIGAGNFDSEHDNYRRIHGKREIDLASIHRATDQDWDKSADLAGGEPVFFGEVYDRAYDDGCLPLGPDATASRARRVRDDLRAAIEDGIDGYFLWDYAVGAVRRSGGEVKYYCSEFGYEADDPLWSSLIESGLPPAAP
jgi:beta-galactosidase/beta-glucuronidase